MPSGDASGPGQQPDRVLLPYAESDHEAQSWFAAFREALRTRAKARGVRFGRKAKANATSAKGGAIATASRRKSRRDWQKLERMPFHDLKISSIRISPVVERCPLFICVS
jgi:hypothetical protein